MQIFSAFERSKTKIPFAVMELIVIYHSEIPIISKRIYETSVSIAYPRSLCIVAY